MNPETPEADAAEQARPAEELIEDDTQVDEVPLDADPADHVDQQREVPQDEADEHD